MPAGVPDGGEAPPDRAVGYQRMALKLVLEQALQVRDRGLLVVLAEPARLPGLLSGLDDEGRSTGRVLVGVGAPEAGPRRLEVERERGEGAGAAEPDEAVPAPVEMGLELIGHP